MANTQKSSKRHRLECVNGAAAGIDVGSAFHVVAVGPERDTESVRSFKSFTSDLHRLADWLVDCGITTVAMESTGVYWIPVFEILEQRGLEVILANARHLKSVPGRKSDVNDAQWIQQLHQYGLLRGSFLPHNDIAALRSYLRHRERLVEYAAAHIQHMQKSLMQMNVQLHHVVSDITGATGMRIIRAIMAGQRDPMELAKMRDSRCKKSVETIAAALTGNYRDEHVFTLGQALELFDFYHAKMAECDKEMAKCLSLLNRDSPASAKTLPAARHRTKQPNEPHFAVREALYVATGKDMTQIHGIGPYTALRLLAECGNDMTRWPTAKHFTSWLTLAPCNKVSGGKQLSSATRRSSNRAATLLRIAAVNIGKTQTALGAFYRRLAARTGKAKAVTATARKIAVLYYNAMRYGMTYVDPGVQYYENAYRQRAIAALKRRAKHLGFDVLDTQESAAAVGVS